jgi:5-methylcytosine-specific restriction enzyme subunit McrC
MKTLDLTEEVPGTFSGQMIDSNTAKQIHDEHRNKIALEYNPWNNTYSIQSLGFIGCIPINDNYTLRIKPKVEINNVFRMLEYAYKLKSFELLSRITSIESIEDFFENFVSILAKRILDRNRRGLYFDYIEECDTLPCFKGRTKLESTAISVLRGKLRPTCQYEEHTSDLVENQILLWTLFQLRYFQFKRPEVKRLVEKGYRELIHKTSLEQIKPSDCINRFYNRLNDDYRPLHALCRFFLEHVGPAIEKGSYEFSPFVIYMPNLFETFVAEWLKAKLPNCYKVSSQFVANFDANGKFEFRIDIVINDSLTGETLAVLDTKYKTHEKPLETDIYQVFTYAATLDAKNAFLIYPTKLQIPLQTTRRGITVRSIVFDISKDIEKSGNNFVDQLVSLLRES